VRKEIAAKNYIIYIMLLLFTPAAIASSHLEQATSGRLLHRKLREDSGTQLAYEYQVKNDLSLKLIIRLLLVVRSENV
jgi:hypothetical protein